MIDASADRSTEAQQKIPAGCLPAWDVGPLEPPPPPKRGVMALLGPGVLLAGSSIGAGEWLFGPAVTVQYGGTLLWLATISILVQVFYNLEVVRYTLYCGEPVFAGYFRTRPGPKFWTAVYVTLFIAHIWPFMASNAAIPLTAAILGHLPGDASLHWAGMTFTEKQLVQFLGFVVFGLSLVALVFGGTVYRMLESVMAFKLVVVLTFLVSLDVAFASWDNVNEILTGFVRFGQVPLRAETVVDGKYFSVAERDGERTYRLRGTIRDGAATVAAFDTKGKGSWRAVAKDESALPEWTDRKERLTNKALALSESERFTVESVSGDQVLRIAGTVEKSRWTADFVSIAGPQGSELFNSIDALPEPQRQAATDLVANRGFQRVGLWSYWSTHGRLPDVDWGIVAAFAAIAGAGGLSNALFSNFARDKGWGMGSQTGAIPSAIGGRQIALSHVGRAFEVTPENLSAWKGWRRHVFKDQVGMWMMCSFIGMALPCMMSLEFLRNAPVSDHQVAAMTAEGIASRFPAWRAVWWPLVLAISFLMLAPNSIFSGDMIARVWTDLLWIGSPRMRKLGEENVWRVYYSVVGIYAVWGMIALALLNPLRIAVLAANLMNVALGFSAFHTIYTNRTLLPGELRPSLFTELGLAACGVFFFLMTGLAVWSRFM